MRIRRIPGLLLLAIILTTAGCGTYYKVTDPTSGRVYYTDEVKRTSGGTVQFQDAKSGAHHPADVGGAGDLERRLQEEHR